MLRLLIVDDEPYTVDGLFEMLEELSDPELDLYKAYGPEEAVDWLNRTKMDIVLSDIRMPGMTGLELQKVIAELWPRCRIIFLTGINDLQTAQTAMRSGSVDYILKTEGDEAIVRSIRKAADELSKELLSDEFLLKAKDRLHRALPLLQRQWFAELLEEGGAACRLREEQLRELSIPLRPSLPVIPVVGRVDAWGGGITGPDRTLLHYAIQNIASECFGTVAFLPVLMESGLLVFLIQPAGPPPAAGGGPDDGAAAWRQAVSYVRGTLETVQDACRRLLKLTVSFVGAASPVEWERLAQAIFHMRMKLVDGLGTGTEMLLSVRPLEREDGSPLPPLRSLIDPLERLMEERLEEQFLQKLQETLALPGSYLQYMQVYYPVASLLLGQLEVSAIGGVDTERLMHLSAHPSREDATRCLLDTAAHIFAMRRELQDERTHQVIGRLHHYIRGHLDGDLSLAKLAEVVYLNPTYLSVLYKQQTGANLSEYIADVRLEKAKELLDTTQMKIHEITDRVGFVTAGYFTRFFKKRLGMTPQEYRSRTR